MSKAQKNRVVSDETRKKISEVLKGNSNGKGKRSIEFSIKMSMIRTGKHQSNDTRKKLSDITHNRSWINNGYRNLRIPNSEIQQYLDMGWVSGMIFHNR